MPRQCSHTNSEARITHPKQSSPARQCGIVIKAYCDSSKVKTSDLPTASILQLLSASSIDLTSLLQPREDVQCQTCRLRRCGRRCRFRYDHISSSIAAFGTVLTSFDSIRSLQPPRPISPTPGSIAPRPPCSLSISRRVSSRSFTTWSRARSETTSSPSASLASTSTCRPSLPPARRRDQMDRSLPRSLRTIPRHHTSSARAKSTLGIARCVFCLS